MYNTYKKLSDISSRQKSTILDIFGNEADAVSNNILCFLIMVCEKNFHTNVCIPRTACFITISERYTMEKLLYTNQKDSYTLYDNHS